MEKIKNEFDNLYTLIKNYGSVISKILKYRGNKHYNTKKKEFFIDINHSLKKIKRLVKEDTLNFKEIEPLILKLIDNKCEYKEKQDILQDIELKWQDLRLDLENVKVVNETHKIPSEIPYTDVRFDLEEAIHDYQNGCFLSSIVMCRRAYEGALISKYKLVENKEPIKQMICKHCKNVIRDKVFFGIVELHNWAIENKIISDKFKEVGFLVSNLGAGSAHPAESFPRDSEVANIAIITSLVLLKQIHSK